MNNRDMFEENNKKLDNRSLFITSESKKENNRAFFKDDISTIDNASFFNDIVKDEKMKNNVLTEEYMDWLEKFTNQYSSFCDSDWLYSSERLEKKDSENVDRLQYLVEAIEEYCNENYILPTVEEDLEYYPLNYKDSCYKIGKREGQGIVCYCIRTDVYKYGIDFYEVKNNIKRPIVFEFDSKLQALDHMIDILKESGIPNHMILERIKERLESYTKNNTNRAMFK